MLLKSYEKVGCSAVWSNSKNHSDHLICTSANDSNSNLYDLELLSIDFGDRSKHLNVAGKAVYNTPFRSLAWGTFGERQGTLPYGLIFGGMQNGSFTLWNPADLLGITADIGEQYIEEQKSFIYAEEPDQDGYPILCAEWNNLKNNFLAFGSTSLLLLDVGKDVSNPDILKPSQHNPHEGSYISSVSWNKQVPHILASAGSDGLIALWDIKENKSIFSFKDSAPSSSYRQAQIAWSKHISTQIAVTLDDQKKNQLQIWDLRHNKGPIVVIDKHHTKGINSIDWSDTDPDLILASSRDRKMICWNYKNDQTPLAVKQLSSDINKVSWSRTLSSIYSVTTNDSVDIYSMDDKNLLSYVPKWLKVPTGTTFNGNNNLLNYSDQKPTVIQEFTIQTQTKENIADNISQLQYFLEHKNLQKYKKMAENEQTFWKLISTKKNQESDSDIYNFLGFNKEKIIKEVEKYTGKKRESFSQNNSKKKNKVSKADYIPVSGMEAASFFGSLGTSATHTKRLEIQDENQQENIKYDMVPRNFNWNMGKQKLIKENMLIGNYEGAIDAALKCGRTAQALIIAYSLDQNTFNNTLKTFFTETTDHFISDILKHIAFKDTEELVLKYELKKWKQCIALIYSISSTEKRKRLLKLLGQRLCEQSENDQELDEAAIYCAILADQFDFVIKVFSERLSLTKSIHNRKADIVHYCTKLLGVYDSLNISVPISISFEKILKETAIVCLEAGRKLAAYNIFTTYLSSTSFRFIDYLINNTEELIQYKSNSLNIVSLPMMTRKVQQQKQAQKQKKKGQVKRIFQQQQQMPTNIRPQVNIARQAPVSYEDEDKPKKTVTSYQQAARNRNNPPPAPHKRTGGPQIIQTFAPEQPQHDNSTSHNLPPNKMAKKPPPPPPKPQNKGQNQLVSTTEYNKVPPPPSPSNYQNNNNSSRIQSKTSIPPPPPPSQPTKNPKVRPPVKRQVQNVNQSKQQQEEDSFYQNQAQSRNPPPSVNQKKKNPPPPPPKAATLPSPKTSIQPTPPGLNRRTPPPPQQKLQQPQEDDYDDEEDDQYNEDYQSQPSNYPQQQPKYNQPPPSKIPQQKQIKRPPPPPQQNLAQKRPPPPTNLQKQDTHQSQESDTSYHQQTRPEIKKGPPRKIPPPPKR